MFELSILPRPVPQRAPRGLPLLVSDRDHLQSFTINFDVISSDLSDLILVTLLQSIDWQCCHRGCLRKDGCRPHAEHDGVVGSGIVAVGLGAEDGARE